MVKVILAVLLSLAVVAQASTLSTPRGEVNISVPPKRLAVFNLGSLDTLQALGVPVIGAPSERFIDSLNTITATSIGTVLQADIEALHGMQPDLIIVGERSVSQYDVVKTIATTVDLSLGQGGGANIYQNGIKRLKELGRLFQREALAEKIASELNQQRNQARHAAQNAGKGMVVMVSGKQLSLLGNASLTGWIISELALETITDSDYDAEAISDIKPISFEYIYAQNPEWLIIADRNYALGKTGSMSTSAFFDTPMVTQTAAVKNQRMIYLDSADALLSIGGVQAMKRVLASLTVAFSQ